jgi:hypothetical protein
MAARDDIKFTEANLEKLGDAKLNEIVDKVLRSRKGSKAFKSLMRSVMRSAMRSTMRAMSSGSAPTGAGRRSTRK